jgi:hypothetical protein
MSLPQIPAKNKGFCVFFSYDNSACGSISTPRLLDNLISCSSRMADASTYDHGHGPLEQN